MYTQSKPYRKCLGISPLLLTSLPQQNHIPTLLCSLQWRSSGHRNIFWCPRQDVSVVYRHLLSPGLLSRDIKNTVLVPVQRTAYTSWTIPGRIIFCCLPCPFHCPVRGCICPSVSHSAPSQSLGILLFVSTRNGLSSCLHSFYLLKESSQAMTPGCLQSLSKTICVWIAQQRTSQLRLILGHWLPKGILPRNSFILSSSAWEERLWVTINPFFKRKSKSSSF